MKDVKSMSQRIENDHKALHKALNQIDNAFEEIPDTTTFKTWKIELLWQLRDFLNQLQKHFDLEESGGFNEELSRIAPQLLSKVEHLEEEHLKIVSDLTHILGVLKAVHHPDSGKLERVQHRVEALTAFIRAHEAAEHAIIQEAYFQDYGVGD